MQIWSNLRFVKLLKNLLKNKFPLLKRVASHRIDTSSRVEGGGAKYRSRFGGLWTDLSNAESVIRGKIELGLISQQEANGVNPINWTVIWLKLERSRWDSVVQ